MKPSYWRTEAFIIHLLADYAVFYATQALFLKYRITVRTHAGMKSMLGLHFISKGIMALEHGRTFNNLFDLRHDNDYDDFVYCDKETVEEYMPRAKAFIGEVEKLIETK